MSLNHAYLFDGALLREHGETLDALQTQHAVYLYEDLGNEAASVGPILMPGNPALLAFANGLVNAEDSRRFATSQLTYRGPLEKLAAHLSRLRVLETTHEEVRRYFLRYADTRVLSVLGQVATHAQVHDLMNGIERWAWVEPDKTFVELRRDADWNGPSSGLPLRFSPKQLSSFLRQGRHHELLHATLVHCPSLAAYGTLGERHAWTQQTCKWLKDENIRCSDTQVAINEAVWRTRGAALASAEFSALVHDAQAEGGAVAIRRWSAAHALRRTV